MANINVSSDWGIGSSAQALNVDGGSQNPGALAMSKDRVGIGTVLPTKKLEVKGDVLIAGDNWGSGEDAVINIGDTNHYIKSVYANGVRIGTFEVGDVITIRQNSGNVGIGTTNPSENLEIAKSTGARLIVSDNQGAEKRVLLLQAPTSSQDFARIVAYKYGTGACEKNLILQDTGGKVGIGTPLPTQKLEVKGDVLITGENWGSGEDAVINLGDNNHYIKSIWGDGVRIGSHGIGDVVTIKQDIGNVGIGTTTPDNKLCVEGSANYIKIKCSTYAAANYLCPVLQMTKSNTDSFGVKATTENGDLLGLIEWFGVNNNVSPAFAKGAQVLVIQEGDAGAEHIPARMEFKVATNGSGVETAMTINSVGSVGIGTISPTSGVKLHIAGKIKIGEWTIEG